MASYNVFVPGVEMTSRIDTQNITGGLSADPQVGTLFQGVTGTSAANAVAVVEGAFVSNFDTVCHVFLVSNDTTV